MHPVEQGGHRSYFFNRPERLNAFNRQMLKELNGTRSMRGRSQIRVILITGTGRGFCAGQDLTERKNEDGELPRDLGKALKKTITH